MRQLFAELHETANKTGVKIEEKRPVVVRRLPILARDVLEADGSSSASLHVYCPGKLKTLPLDDCRTCPQTVAIDGPHLCCTPHVPPHSLTIGELIEGARFVRDDVPTRLLASVVHPTIPLLVIDATHRLVGIVGESDVLASFGRSGTTGEIASRVVPIVAGSDIRRAVMHLALSHSRHAPVVDSEHTPLGLLLDTHAMRWLRTQ